MRRARLVAILCAAACIAAAGDPAERLADGHQESRSRAIFRETRCLVCQGESIDDSDSELARDLRRIIRDQVAAGRSDGQVRDFLVARYGDFVLFRPRLSATNALLWGSPFLAAAVGGILLYCRRKAGVAPAPLSPQEEARIASLNDPEDI